MEKEDVPEATLQESPFSLTEALQLRPRKSPPLAGVHAPLGTTPQLPPSLATDLHTPAALLCSLSKTSRMSSDSKSPQNPRTACRSGFTAVSAATAVSTLSAPSSSTTTLAPAAAAIAPSAFPPPTSSTIRTLRGFCPGCNRREEEERRCATAGEGDDERFVLGPLLPFGGTVGVLRSVPIMPSLFSQYVEDASPCWAPLPVVKKVPTPYLPMKEWVCDTEDREPVVSRGLTFDFFPAADRGLGRASIFFFELEDVLWWVAQELYSAEGVA